MCTAMLGATPVNRWTCAASSAFSHGVRGTPGWPNTLNRVPVFPNAQEGSSILCCRSAALTAARSRIPFISTSPTPAHAVSDTPPTAPPSPAPQSTPSPRAPASVPWLLGRWAIVPALTGTTAHRPPSGVLEVEVVDVGGAEDVGRAEQN